ncbi:MAG: hypothetical protein ACFFAH_04605 [Promethearchaeota archaeon]
MKNFRAIFKTSLILDILKEEIQSYFIMLNSFSLKKNFITIIGFFFGLSLGLITIILPWYFRIKFLKILGFVSRVALEFNFIIDFVSNEAFASEADKQILTQ